MILTAAARRRNAAPSYPLPDSATAAPWNSSTTPNTIPTYEGSGATIHPSVVDMGGDWNGFRWWMANTPYPGKDDNYENPSIWGSNDRTTWNVPAGLVNPIDPDPGGSAFHSDTELVYDPEMARLVVFYRRNIGATRELRAQSSANGSAWTNHGLLLQLDTDKPLASPAVVREDAGQWRMWLFVEGVGYRTADNPLGPWSESNYCTLDGSTWIGSAWHGDVILHNDTYYAIYTDSSSSGNVWATTSSDGLAWSARVLLMDGGAGGGWDQTLYRPTIIPSTEAGYFDCWYSAYSTSVPGGCATGYVRLPISLWPDPPT